MRKPRYKSGSAIDGWTLEKLLGIGGNAEVWRASREANDPVALKILNQKRIQSEPYIRFRDEVRVLEMLDDEDGVLPIIESSVPNTQEKGSVAWLAMPVATLIKDALGDPADFREVLAAICVVAETLSRMTKREIYHRDIKPENIYQYQDRWVIGDFGLAAFRERSGITEKVKKLGPTHYIADEMLLDPVKAAAAPADVFALAKTLWVLCSGENYPVQGTIDATNEKVRISAYESDPAAPMLDLLVEQCTQREPGERPTMADFASELSAIITRRKDKSTPPEIAEVAARLDPIIRELADDAGVRSDLEQKLETYATESILRLEPLRKTVADNLKVDAEISRENHLGTLLSMHTELFAHNPDRFANGCVNVCAGNKSVCDNLLISGFFIELFLNQQVRITAGHGTRFRDDVLFWHKTEVARAGTAMAAEKFVELQHELERTLPESLEKLANLRSGEGQ